MQLADHGVDPDPGRRGPQVLHADGPVLGVGLQVGAFAEVLLDLLQQLHGRVGGGHPPRRAVLVHQDQAGSVDLQDRPGGLGDPQQPGHQVIGLGQGRPQLADGPGDHLTVHRHRLILLVAPPPGMLAPPDRLGNGEWAAQVTGSGVRRRAGRAISSSAPSLRSTPSIQGVAPPAGGLQSGRYDGDEGTGEPAAVRRLAFSLGPLGRAERWLPAARAVDQGRSPP
jgi:hypothetical protein